MSRWSCRPTDQDVTETSMKSLDFSRRVEQQEQTVGASALTGTMTPAERQWGRRYKYARPKNIPEYPGLSWKEPHLILAVFEVLVFRWNYISGNPQKPMETSGAIETIFQIS